MRIRFDPGKVAASISAEVERLNKRNEEAAFLLRKASTRIAMDDLDFMIEIEDWLNDATPEATTPGLGDVAQLAAGLPGAKEGAPR